MPINASAQIWVLDGVASATGSPPFPDTQGRPANYYIVIDDIFLNIAANAAGDYKVTIAADDAQTIMVVGKTFVLSEAETFHLSFPKGLVIPKLTKVGPASGRISAQSTAAYSNAAMFTLSGAPNLCTLTVAYRYVAPSSLDF